MDLSIGQVSSISQDTYNEIAERFEEYEQNSIWNAVNDTNAEFLDEILQLRYFDGKQPYTSAGVKIVLQAINDNTYDRVQEILSGDLTKLDYFPLELVELINNSDIEINNDNKSDNFIKQDSSVQRTQTPYITSGPEPTHRITTPSPTNTNPPMPELTPNPFINIPTPPPTSTSTMYDAPAPEPMPIDPTKRIVEPMVTEGPSEIAEPMETERTHEPELNNEPEISDADAYAMLLLLMPFLNFTQMINSKDAHEEYSAEEINVYQSVLNNLYGSEVEYFFFDKSTDEECLALEKEMADIGVRVTYANNVDTAREITQVYKDLYQRGYELPKQLILVDFVSDTKEGATLKVPREYIKNVPIFYNIDIANSEQHPQENALQEMLMDLDLNWFSTDDSLGVIYHEMGHYLQSDMSFEEAQRIWESAQNKQDIGREVSAYAIIGDDTGAEFVAEVFAGCMMGKEYSAEVMDLYYALGGVEIK